MSEPPTKRRRTNSPEERASSPLRQPPRRRPSFASPTKASLARNYPNLLPSTSTLDASSHRSSRGDVLARGRQARAFVLGETDPQQETVQDRFNEYDTSQTTAGAQQLPKAQNNTPQEGFRDILEEEEPELPTTPSHTGLEQHAEPRRGVLFSSPTKRPPRVKDRVKQSPLRPKAPPVQSDDTTRTVEDGPTEADTQNVAQIRLPPDPEVEERKREKARLHRELEELESQVSSTVNEIVKEQHRDADEALRLTERAHLSKLISKISESESEPEKPAVISDLLCSFLPFSALPVPQPRSSPPTRLIPSHRPVELVDPLPYLEMFTSLKFSTQPSLPRGKVFPASKRVHQKYTVDIVGPRKLLTAQVSVNIDALANNIIDMHILRISPWAERELGTFIRKKAQEKDLGNACWAIDSYWEIAQKRAQHWHKCQTAFAHLTPGRTNEDTENYQQKDKQSKTIARKDLSRNLGRDTLVLQDKNVLLKLDWRISFDWTGEAESEITIELAFPQVWFETDNAASLRKVPETFASLLRTKGVYEATRIMVTLLFPS
ncbi:hypothetical protein BDW02DRAFT_603206 [Decorospora gaudefroyi]|uniref:Uncharacterized protein n=1 Tax=Decorospora gaudefroyi TaxID=184978 RepID=A0A6A5JX48_9PLEO|nr:hypothetical protein BDW02DRAFT_603206 [Decorospora gaudefroyi]